MPTLAELMHLYMAPRAAGRRCTNPMPTQTALKHLHMAPQAEKFELGTRTGGAEARARGAAAAARCR